MKNDTAPSAQSIIVPKILKLLPLSVCLLTTTLFAAGASGATDVTGFGLLGHAGRMAQESGVGLEIIVDNVPVIVGATALAADGVVPGGTGRNLAWIEEWLDIGAGVGELDVTILADAQTSGGLVFGVDPDAADDVAAGLVADGHTAAVIGCAVNGNGQIALRRS